jgi:hypothetical protein
MACSFPYIEKNFRNSNPEVADKLNQIGLDTWTEIKDSNLFTKKDGSYVFNKQGTIRREKQNQLANSINDNLGGNVVTEIDKKVAVNLVPIFNRFQLAEPTPQPEGSPVVLESPTVSEEPVFPKVDTVRLEWDEYEKMLENPGKASVSSAHLISKFQGYDSLEQYKEVATGVNPQAFSEYADTKLYELLKDFTDTAGIDIKDIAEFQQNYLERTGKIISASGVADLINKTIYVTDGNLDALTEEVAHFIVAMLPKDNPLYQAIDAYLDNTPEFEIYYDVYLDKYQGDERKTRNEIMGKIIKNVFQGNQEKAPLSLKTVINYILDYFRSIFSDKAMEYKEATANIKQMFFSQSLVENLSEVDTADEELYQLSYDLVGDRKNKGVSAQNIIAKNLDALFNNIVTQLENYANKAVETGNTLGASTANRLLLKISEGLEQNLEKDVLFVEVQKIISKNLNGINQSFGQLAKDNLDAVSSLFKKGGEYSVEEMTKLQNDEYGKRIKQIGSYINYIQGLKDFANTLKGLRETVAALENDVPEYKEIVRLLNPELANNSDFLTSMKYMSLVDIDKKITDIESVYNNAMKMLVEGLVNATTTADQRDFIEKNNINLFPSFSTKEYNEGSINDKLTWLRISLTPTSLQNDIYLQNVNNFVNFILRNAQENTNKAKAEILDLQAQTGFANQEFFSSKDENGNLTFQLLSKYNYTVFAKQKTDYLLSVGLKNLINTPLLGPEAKKLLSNLQKESFSSPKEIYKIISDEYTGKKDILSDEEFNYIDNYLRTLEDYYNVKRFVPSQGLSDVASDAIKNYIETSRRVYKEAFDNPNFDWSSENVKSVLSSELDAFELYPAVMEKIEEKRKLLEKQYYTFDPDTTDIETNLPFKSQYFKVQGLLNFYKSTLGYTEDEGGLFDPSLLNTNKFGEQYLFELSGEEVDGIPAKYVDEEYKKLEEDAKDGTNKKAIAKLKLIELARNHNKVNNNPINDLANYPKRESEYNTFKLFGKRYRVYDFVTRIAIPSAFALYITPSIMTLDFNAMNQIDFFTNLSNYSKIGAFLFNVYVAKQFVRALSIFTDNFSREINTLKDAKKIINILGKSLGMTYKAFDLEIFQEEENRFPSFKEADFDGKMQNWFARVIDKVKNIFEKRQYKLNLPNSYQPLNMIPQWQKNRLPAALRSTQFIDNLAQDIASTNDYNAKVSFEGVIKYMDKVYKDRTDVPVSTKDFVENAYINRVWYGRVAPKNVIYKILSGITRLVGKVSLLGNIYTDIKNIFQGIYPIIIQGGPLLTSKVAAKATMYSLKMSLYAITNDKMAVEANYIQQVKKQMRILQQAGITEVDTGQSVFSRKFRLSNERMFSALGESFISSMVAYMLMENNKLVDEKGKTYDLAKNTEQSGGKFRVKKGAPQPYFSFITKGQVNDLSASDLSLINPAGKVNVSNLSAEGKKLLTPSNIDIENYLNLSFFNALEHFAQKTQGVYNTLDKPVIATTTIGHVIFQFANHVIPQAQSAFGRKKYNLATSEIEDPFVTGSMKLLLDLVKLPVTAGVKSNVFQEFLKKWGKDYEGKYKEENKAQLQNVQDFLSLTNKSTVFAAELLAISNLLTSNFTNKEIRSLAKGIADGTLKYNGLEDSNLTEDEIFKILYSNYIENKEANTYKARSLRKFATASLLLAGTGKLAMFLLSKVKTPDDEDDVNEWLKFFAFLGQTLRAETISNFTPVSLLQKLGVNTKQIFNLDLYGKGAYGPLGVVDPLGSVVTSSFAAENTKNLIWAANAFYYNNFGKKSMPFYNDKQEAVIKKVTEGKDLPYARPQYKIKTKPSGKKGKPGKSKLIKETNMVEQQILDYIFTPRYRDIYKQNPLKADYYKKLPKKSLDMLNSLQEKGYLRQTGRVIIEDLTPSQEMLEEMNKKDNPEK